MLKERIRRGPALSCALATLAILATAGPFWIATEARAEEALADLDLRATVTAVEPVRAAGDTPAAVADVDLVLQSVRSASGVTVRVTTPDGRDWTIEGMPFDGGAVSWKRPDGGEPLEAEDGSVLLPARSPLHGSLRVPARGRALHEVVIEVRAATEDGDLVATAVVRIPVGVPSSPVVDDGEVATFPMEVRP